jgi:hypothetical protein
MIYSDLSNVPLLPRTLIIEGVEVGGDVLADIIRAIVRPDPKVWYRFERIETDGVAQVYVTRKIDDAS